MSPPSSAAGPLLARRSSGLLTVLLLAGCGSDPHADEVEPAMSRAVQAVLDGSGDAPVVRELLPDCGPTDAPEGLVLRLSAALREPPGADAVAQLRAQRLDVQTGSGDGEPLLTAQPDGDAWRLEVVRSERTALLVVAQADVDDGSATAERPVTVACG